MSKTFPGQKALDQVSLAVAPGEIHALVGENGSGKSTLIKCLAGFHTPDPGSRVFVDGKQLPDSYPPSASWSYGLSFMHQDLGLIRSLTVLENLGFGHGFVRAPGGRINWKANEARAAQLLELTGHEISPRAEVRSLSKADQALVAMARVLGNPEARVAVFDEPTSALTDSESARLLEGIRRIAARGVGVIYVSHRLNEVIDLSERVTVLRNGKLVGTHRTAELTVDRLVEEIVGGELASVMKESRQRHPVPRSAAPVFRATDVSGPGVEDVSFEIAEGEILGVAGLLGSGRTELANLLFGAARIESGSIELRGEELRLRSPRDAIRAGIAMVPEDRLSEGIFGSLSAAENATVLQAGRYWSALGFRRRKEAAHVKELMDEYAVRPPFPERPLKSFSGGNQQKVVIAKWLRNEPDLLILDEPLHGVDVGAKAEVIRIVEQAAERGMSVLYIDSDFENLLDVCRRVLVMAGGRVSAFLEADDVSRDRIVRAAYGRATTASQERAIEPS